ncbi:MAG: SDR family oxidoreductase [Actinomycetota bacterium]|nr:SDR family oxidoreductase [Actinomycetota bacterium]
MAAIVTGGSRGVGLAIARALKAAGHEVALVARSKDELAAAARELGALALSADVRDPGAVEEAAARVEQELGPTDLLVNNAGTLAAIGPLWEVEASDWWLDVETSLRGALLWSQAVLPGMLERGRGRIVNVSSYAAIRPSPYQSGYAAAKAALLSLTESLAASSAGTGVSVFAISPGFVRTAMTDRLRESDEGRRWLPEVGSGGEVDAARSGELVAFLASGAADGLSGRFLPALDDVEDLAGRAEEIVRDDLYVMRLRKPE